MRKGEAIEVHCLLESITYLGVHFPNTTRSVVRSLPTTS